MITIAFFSSSFLVSEAISLVENSPISHTAIGLAYNNQPYFLQQDSSGVQLTPRSGLLSNHTLIAEFQILPIISDYIIAAAEARVGQKYDFLTILGFIFVFLGQLFKVQINNPFVSQDSAVCSEFIVQVLQSSIPEFMNLAPANIDPAALYQICVSGKSFQRISSS